MKASVVLFAAALGSLAQPCFASDWTVNGNYFPERPGAFVGAAMRMPLSTNKSMTPTFGLQLGLERISSTPSSPGRANKYPLFEIAAARVEGTRFYIGGQDLEEAKERFRLDGSREDLLVGIGVFAVLVGAVLLAREAHAGL